MILERMLIQDNIIILNQAYYLRNDVHRAIIGTFEFPSVDKQLFDAHILYRIHPVVAQLLSFFSQPISLKKAIDDIHNFFGLETSDIISILTPMVNNKIKIQHDYCGVIMTLPKYILIDYDKVNLRADKEIYSYQDFLTDGLIDLTTVRLYKPIHMIMELTMKCYTDCLYCYADRAGHKIAMDEQLALKTIDEAHRLRFTNIEINGGEVLSHPNIWPILERLTAYGYYPFISTKMPLNEKKLLKLKELGLNRIQISLDSIDSSIESDLLNVDNGYLDRIIKTMDLLDFLGFDWQINTVLTKKNCSKEIISNLLSFVLSKYKHLKSIKLAPMAFPMYKRAETFSQLSPDVIKLREIQEVAIQLNKLNPDVDIILSEPDIESDYSCKSWDTFNGRNICTANQKAFNVLPDGKVTICEELYWIPAFIIGDLNSSSIKEIWESDKAKHLFFLDQKSISDTSKCKTCHSFTKCRHTKQVCWKMVVMAYGKSNWDYPDPKCPNSELPYNSFYYKQTN